VGVPDAEAVRAEVRRQAALGVDYIKVYSAMPADLIGVAVEAAHAEGLEAIGHLQRTTWTEGARRGLDHLTHGAPWSMEYLPEAARAGYQGTFRGRMTWLEQVDVDGPAIQEMILVMADSGVTVDPTLIAYRTKFVGDDPRYLVNPDSIYAPPLVRSIWRRGTFTSDWTAADYARGHAVWPRVLDLTKRLYNAGVLLTAGSDVPNPWVIPGVSLHEELQLLHNAGIPPLDVLQIATYNGAVALRLDDEIGSIEVGKEADLVILTADPTLDLANTRTIEAVVVDGQVYRPEELLRAN
ncbi:MAG: amidohydrolase family protein, partial [Rhodothermaceae bacterium]|nr:amidohydrolase family protein [Rhodothermaceae bacterium]